MILLYIFMYNWQKLQIKIEMKQENGSNKLKEEKKTIAVVKHTVRQDKLN